MDRPADPMGNAPTPLAARAQRNGMIPVATALVVAALLVAGLGEPAAALLRYERRAVLAGDAWRLVTGHLVHLGWIHLALNAAGLALVAVLLGAQWRARQWAALALACALGVGLGLLAFDPQLAWYVGLSGIAHGLVAAGAVPMALARRGVGLAWVLALAGKLAWEQVRGGTTPAAWIGGATVVDAHLYGALAGALAAAVLCALARRWRSTS